MNQSAAVSLEQTLFEPRASRLVAGSLRRLEGASGCRLGVEGPAASAGRYGCSRARREGVQRAAWWGHLESVWDYKLVEGRACNMRVCSPARMRMEEADQRAKLLADLAIQRQHQAEVKAQINRSNSDECQNWFSECELFIQNNRRWDQDRDRAHRTCLHYGFGIEFHELRVKPSRCAYAGMTP
jgi:hypothetical protein